jgi:glycosyltransferase involved in cell wall biosynthesis
MTDPRVSVVIPAYNAARTVGHALDSVLAQTFSDFEVLVIDDGSTDDTAKVVRARNDPRVRCITTANGGVSRARNHGIELSAAPLIAFLDADDLWFPMKLERQVETMAAHPTAGLSFTSVELVDGDLGHIGVIHAENYSDFCEALLVIGNIIGGSASSAMLRRSVLQAIGGFDPDLSQCADWDLWLRASLESEFVPITEVLMRYRKAPGSMSSDPDLLERDTFALLDRFFSTAASAPYQPVKRKAYANHWMICAGTYLHAGRRGDAIRCVGHGLTEDPRSLRRPLLLPGRRLARLARSRRAAAS